MSENINSAIPPETQVVSGVTTPKINQAPVNTEDPVDRENIRIANVEDLQTQHKDFYKEIIKYVAIQIVNDMKKGQERIKRAGRSGG